MIDWRHIRTVPTNGTAVRLKYRGYFGGWLEGDYRWTESGWESVDEPGVFLGLKPRRWRARTKAESENLVKTEPKNG